LRSGSSRQHLGHSLCSHRRLLQQCLLCKRLLQGLCLPQFPVAVWLLAVVVLVVLVVWVCLCC
jgi:hypothetical protein